MRRIGCGHSKLHEALEIRELEQCIQRIREILDISYPEKSGAIVDLLRDGPRRMEGITAIAKQEIMQLIK